MATYKVLIPLDGSRLAETSLAYLSPLKLIGDLEVNLVTVVDETRLKLQGDDDAQERELLETYTNSVAERVRSRMEVPVHVHVLSGVPWTSILEVSSTVAPDLLLITTHGRSGLDRWRLGSVADKVIRGAMCSVLAIGPHALGRVDWSDSRFTTSIRRILVPLDGSQLAEAALPTAERMAEASGAQLHLVGVVTIPALAGAPAPNFGSVLQVLLDASVEYLHGVVQRRGLTSAKTETMLGYVADVLQAYVTNKAIDLIVMTSHGRSGLARAALGSVTDRMIGAPAPVLIVRIDHPKADI